MAEFVMVSALVVFLFMGLVQLALFLHVKNMAQDAATHGARYGALADRDASDGAARARELIESTIAAGPAAVSAETVGGPAGDTVVVHVSVRVPLLGLAPAPVPISVQAQATRFE